MRSHRRGVQAIRPDWVAQVQEANRVDLAGLAGSLTELVLSLQAKQQAAFHAKEQAFQTLRGPA